VLHRRYDRIETVLCIVLAEAEIEVLGLLEAAELQHVLGDPDQRGDDLVLIDVRQRQHAHSAVEKAFHSFLF